MNSLFDITLWAFPSSLIIAVGYIAVLFLINHYCKNSKLYKDFSSIKSALFLTLILLLLIIIEGIWAIDIYHRWYFLVSALFFMSNLGFAIIKRVNKKAGIGFLMNHIGLFLIVWGMFFGAPDYEKGGILLENGFEERFAQKESGEMMPLPFKIELESFRIDYYEDSITPKQFISSVLINGEQKEISVNSPLRYGNYYLYQNSYDMENLRYSILQIVYDPWIWVIWSGVILLTIGALLMIFKK